MPQVSKLMRSITKKTIIGLNNLSSPLLQWIGIRFKFINPITNQNMAKLI
jgi:hypothetical protein